MKESRHDNNPDINTTSYVARQPIVDGKKKVFGYELLYRDGPNNAFPDIDPDVATQRLLVEQFLIRQSRVLEGKAGFVNFHNVSLLKKVPCDFSKDHYVVEILESCEPTKELLCVLEELKLSGYLLALDDFTPSDKWADFYHLIDIIKFDIRLCPIVNCKTTLESLKSYDIQFLAEKVETIEEFKEAKEAGFHLFQGYFFKKPEIVENRKVDHSLDANIRLCQAVAQTKLDIAEIESIISHDSTLSFELLNFVNASSVISSPIRSFRQALIYLGEERIRKFASYVAIATANPNKPSILMLTALRRAKFFSLLLNSRHHLVSYQSIGYLTGLLSVMDAILDSDLNNIIEPLNIDPKIKCGLLFEEGVLGLLVQLADALEYSDWKRIDDIKSKLGVDDGAIIGCDVESWLWAGELGIV